MNVVIGFLIIIVVLSLAYPLVLRPWLEQQTWAKTFFSKIEPAEIALFKKSETVLVGRLVWLGGMIVTCYDGITTYFSSLSWEPLTTRIMDFLHIPPDLRSLTLSAAMTGLGLAIVRLRKTTTKPLELVAAPSNLPPAATAAVLRAEATKNAAVVAIQDATPVKPIGGGEVVG